MDWGSRKAPGTRTRDLCSNPVLFSPLCCTRDNLLNILGLSFITYKVGMMIFTQNNSLKCCQEQMKECSKELLCNMSHVIKMWMFILDVWVYLEINFIIIRYIFHMEWEDKLRETCSIIPKYPLLSLYLSSHLCFTYPRETQIQKSCDFYLWSNSFNFHQFYYSFGK